MNSVQKTDESPSGRNHTNNLSCDTSPNNNDVGTTINNSISPIVSDSGGCRDEPPSAANRKVFVMRHGERVDFTFGTWIPYCFDEFGNYLRKDLNMPKTLPKRINGPESWQSDTPLTNIGLHQAKLVGEGLHECGVEIHHVYCSPSFRCIQTCSSALEGLQVKDRFKINIDPGLFEWMTWYPDGAPDWFTKEELIEANFNINPNYKPTMDTDDLNASVNETVEEFYGRNFATIKKILETTTGNIFVVAHAASLDTCTRELMGRKARDFNELKLALHKIPYCSIVGIEQVKGEWKFMESISLPITHSKNGRFERASVETS